MTVSVRSLAVMWVLPRMSMVIEIGSGDSNLGMEVLLERERCERRAPLTGPAGEALAPERTRPHTALLWVGRPDRDGDGAHQPRVDRQALAPGGLLDPALELLGQAQRDAGRTGVV